MAASPIRTALPLSITVWAIQRLTAFSARDNAWLRKFRAPVARNSRPRAPPQIPDRLLILQSVCQEARKEVRHTRLPSEALATLCREEPDLRREGFLGAESCQVSHSRMSRKSVIQHDTRRWTRDGQGNWQSICIRHGGKCRDDKSPGTQTQ